MKRLAKVVKSKLFFHQSSNPWTRINYLLELSREVFSGKAFARVSFKVATTTRVARQKPKLAVIFYLLTWTGKSAVGRLKQQRGSRRLLLTASRIVCQNNVDDPQIISTKLIATYWLMSSRLASNYASPRVEPKRERVFASFSEFFFFRNVLLFSFILAISSFSILIRYSAVSLCENKKSCTSSLNLQNKTLWRERMGKRGKEEQKH